MSRLAVVCGLLVLGVMLAVGSAPPGAPPAAAQPAKDSTSDTLLAALKGPKLHLPEFPRDAEPTLGVVLDNLEKRYSQPQNKPPFLLSFEFNEAAFKAEGVDDPRAFPIVKEKGMAKTVPTSLDRQLRKLLTRLPVPSGATYIVRQDHIEITTNQAIRPQIWGGHPGPFLPLVHHHAEKKPLDEVLTDLAEQAEHNIVIDARVAEKAKTVVSVRFTNTPLDTAVSMLADMAELRPVLQDNVIYVTTPENALRWEGRQKKDAPPDGDTQSGPRIGAGIRGLVPSTGMAGAGME